MIFIYFLRSTEGWARDRRREKIKARKECRARLGPNLYKKKNKKKIVVNLEKVHLNVKLIFFFIYLFWNCLREKSERGGKKEKKNGKEEERGMGGGGGGVGGGKKTEEDILKFLKAFPLSPNNKTKPFLSCQYQVSLFLSNRSYLPSPYPSEFSFGCLI